jgi:hypothetical protein
MPALLLLLLLPLLLLDGRRAGVEAFQAPRLAGIGFGFGRGLEGRAYALRQALDEVVEVVSPAAPPQLHLGGSHEGDGAPALCFDGGCDVHDGAQVIDEAKHLATKPTVWSEFGALAAETGALNLGQGFPDWEPPEFVVAAAVEALTSGGFNQYTRTAGHPRLVELLARRYGHHFGGEVDAYSQVAITIGASQALYVALQTLLSAGDEVILLEPYFDLYLGQIRMGGGVPRTVPLVPNVGGGWDLDLDALSAAITPRTRAIIINSPHNPTGKVFTAAEMEAIASIIRRHPRIVAISDEVRSSTQAAHGLSLFSSRALSLN